MFCRVTKKVSYETELLALKALIQNHIKNFHRQGDGPINIYQCDHCNNWHFTSRGNKHSDLDSPEMTKEIKKEQLGDYWERRLR